MDVELRDLTVAEIVADVSFTVETGTVVGLVGPNGSGKTTTLRCVYRALVPDGGAVLLGGEPLTGMAPRDSARVMAAVTQDTQVDLDFTVAEVVAMARLPHKGTFDRDTEADAAICAEALAQVDATHLAHRSVLTLSGGERQRVLVARALAQQPRVLVLDEPTNHLDLRHQHEVLALVADTGLTVLTVLHDLNLAAAYCDRVHVLAAGRIVASGQPAEVFTPGLVAEVFGVRAHVVDHPVSGVPQLIYDRLVNLKETL
ncbi:ABC transporter ATP-binding protein [Actinokineospora sp. HUAS TT18]|uniref:ABC transporter ATP-binding protein n=1 Tax=Actinokineospora sp. HUAS TT18 TaxID=3447451 RepID=UPI003F5229B6